MKGPHACRRKSKAQDGEGQGGRHIETRRVSRAMVSAPEGSESGSGEDTGPAKQPRPRAETVGAACRDADQPRCPQSKALTLRDM